MADDLFAAGVRRINVSPRHARPRDLRRADALGQDRADAGRHLRRQGRRPRHQDQRRRAEGRERGRVRPHARLVRRARLRPLPDRDHAAGRHRRRPHRPVPAAVVVRAACGRPGRWRTRLPTGGPARYYTVKETGRRIGFITPMTHNFCESCNRVRLTCTGTLYMCLGQDDAADLRAPLRDPRWTRRAAARRSARPSRASRRGMTSSSTAAARPRRRAPHERDRWLRRCRTLAARLTIPGLPDWVGLVVAAGRSLLLGAGLSC
jgi:hypothetical protein